MTNKKCPCIECICIPACKYKQWFDLNSDCSIVSSYLYFNHNDLGKRQRSNFGNRASGIHNTLKPRYWAARGEGQNTYIETTHMEELDLGRHR